MLLSGVCTLLPFALALVALHHLSAYTVQLVTNLEPVYAIVLAMLLLGEQRELTPQFYLGVAIILAAVFLHPLLNRRRPVQHAELLAQGRRRLMRNVRRHEGQAAEEGQQFDRDVGALADRAGG